jgi:hypothetical protein
MTRHGAVGQIKKPPTKVEGFTSCRGRVRTSTGQLAKAQKKKQPLSYFKLVVDPSHLVSADETALRFVYPVIPTPETRGHVCQRFHHPTVLRTFMMQI